MLLYIYVYMHVCVSMSMCLCVRARVQPLTVLFDTSDVVANVSPQSMPTYTCLVRAFTTRQLVVLLFPLVPLGVAAAVTKVPRAEYPFEGTPCGVLLWEYPS